VALKGVNLDVPRGSVFGLLGPNGAGKTTTVRILSTLLTPTAGRASVLGFDVMRDTAQVRRHVGFVLGGDRGLYGRLTGKENLLYFAALNHMAPRPAAVRADDLLRTVGLYDRRETLVEQYSRGMKQRLHIARGLLTDPDVVFMDEPTIGLDPQVAQEVRAVIPQLASRGKTVLLTTHYMFEADTLCDRIAVIAKGEIVGAGTPAELKSRVADGTVTEIEVFGVDEPAVARLRALDGVTSVAVEEQEQKQLLVVQTSGERELTHAVLGQLDGLTLGRVSSREPTLEDAYVALVTARDEISRVA
jgi:ABC-2 type transport system ATP-binding protein